LRTGSSQLSNARCRIFRAQNSAGVCIFSSEPYREVSRARTRISSSTTSHKDSPSTTRNWSAVSPGSWCPRSRHPFRPTIAPVHSNRFSATPGRPQAPAIERQEPYLSRCITKQRKNRKADAFGADFGMLEALKKRQRASGLELDEFDARPFL
jgi:hypothetical protein